MRGRGHARWLPLLLCGLVMTGGVNADRPSAAVDLAAQDARLRRENDEMRRLLALAGEGSFYLVVDLREQSLRLLLGGVVMREFPFTQPEMRQPRIAWAKRPLQTDWLDQTWSGSQLDPPAQRERYEMVAAAGGSSAPPCPPPTPTELPGGSGDGAYRIRFDGGLWLEILSDSPEDRAPPFAQRIARRLREAGEVWACLLRGSARPSWGVRLRLTPEDASALYRSLPPGTKLVVLCAADWP